MRPQPPTQQRLSQYLSFVHRTFCKQYLKLLPHRMLKTLLRSCLSVSDLFSVIRVVRWQSRTHQNIEIGIVADDRYSA
jgi:hypothetical protein